MIILSLRMVCCAFVFFFNGSHYSSFTLLIIDAADAVAVLNQPVSKELP